jgi:nicotinate-nucleotide adenylyltransferase
MKIGIYGGSFNPIHFGHTGLAKWVLEHTDLDEVWLMVSPNNPLKDKSILADEQERLEKAREAIETLPTSLQGRRVVVSDFEFHLPRPTYTANTMRALANAYPEHEFTLIIGEDNLQIFDKWRESDFLLSHFRIFVYPRHGCPTYEIPQAHDLQILKNAPYFDISSTELRKNLHI